jgi:hypothetical protein
MYLPTTERCVDELPRLRRTVRGLRAPSEEDALSRIIGRAALALAVVAALAAIPALALAKSYSVNLLFKAGPPKGTSISAKISGQPLGKCTMKGTLTIPDTKQVWTCKGGTIKVKGHGTTGAANHAKGTWKVTGGTRKFSGIKGGGTFDGYFSTNTFHYKGTLKF